jgi:hypothetical protein
VPRLVPTVTVAPPMSPTGHTRIARARSRGPNHSTRFCCAMQSFSAWVKPVHDPP